MIHKNLFLLPEILSRLIFTQSENGDFYVQATPQQQARRALPEEIIRQLFILSLIHHYGYPENNIRLEYGVQMGRTRKRADIVILDNNCNPYIVVEVKQILDRSTKDQLESYLAVTKASFGVAVSSDEFFCMNNNGTSQVDVPLFGGTTDITNLIDTLSVVNDQQPARAELQIEGFERINQTHAKITIKGYTVMLSNIEMSTYRKLQRHFLAAGLVIDPGVKQQDWLLIFSRLLDNSPLEQVKIIPTPPVANDINSIVRELLENSNNPLYCKDVICFTPLFEKLSEILPILKNDQGFKLSNSLINLGFSKLSRIRILGKRQTIWGRADKFDPTIDWAKNIIESRLKDI